MASPDQSPFGSDTQKYWDQRYAYFKRFDDGILIDREGLYSVVPEKEGLLIAERAKGLSVLDAFGGVAGSSICFARAGKRVFNVEIDAGRQIMGRNNAGVYGVEKAITWLNKDIRDVVGSVDAETVFFDPPWGGPDYYMREALFMHDFSIGDVNMQDLVAQSRCENVIMRLPKNFAFATVAHCDDLVHYKKVDGQPYFSCVFATAKQFCAIKPGL